MTKIRPRWNIPLSHGNHTIPDSTHKANILNDYFSSEFSTKGALPSPTHDKSIYPDIQPISFTQADGSQFLSTEVHKAPGPDKIPPHLLQLASPEIAPVLTLIFKSSLHQGELPMYWKHTNIIPIYNKLKETNHVHLITEQYQ